jgi:hypothetical protein
MLENVPIPQLNNNNHSRHLILQLHGELVRFVKIVHG